MGWKEKWRQLPKRILASGLALSMIGGSLDLTALEVSAETTDQQVTITAIEPLADEIGVQQLAVGASENEIVFPDTLQATVMYAVDQTADPSDENAENTENNEPAEVTENVQGEESGQTNGTDAGEAASAAGTESGIGETGTENDQNAQDQTTAGESADASGVTEETDYAADEAPASATEQITLSGITWTIDAAQSDAAVFDSSEESNGACYVYTPVLPQTDDSGRLLVMRDDVELPAIYVLVGDPQTALLAESNVIEVDGTQYASVDDAFTNTTVRVGNIKLLQDVELTKPLTLYGSTTLDLNGKTLKNGVTNGSYLLAAEACNLTIKPSSAGGKILTDRTWGTGTLKVYSSASCTIESGVTIEDHTGVSIENSGTFTVKEGATLLNKSQYTSGVVLQNNSGNAILEGGSYTGDRNIKVKGGTLTINGGTYDDIIDVWSDGTLVISGGTFNKKITLPSGRTLQDCMKEGCTLKALDGTTEIDMDSNTLTVPAKAEEATLYFTGQPELTGEQASLLEGYAADETATLTVAAKSDSGTITYQWYVKKAPAGETETEEKLADATSASYRIPAGLAVGSYQYYCVATCENEHVTSEKVVFTVAKKNITTTINGTETKQRYIQQAFDEMQNAINAADEGTSVDITLEIGENITDAVLACILDGTGRNVSLSIDLNGRTVEYTDGSTISSSKVQLTVKNVDVTIKGGGTLYAKLTMQEKSSLTVSDSITFTGWLYMEGGTAKLSTGTWNHAYIEVKDGASCEITGGTYTQQGSIEVEGGGSLKVSGDATIDEPLNVKHTVTADGVKRAEVALSGGSYQSIEVPAALDSMYLTGKSYQCAIVDMLASGYAFCDKSTKEVVTTLSRTSRELTNVTVTQGTMPSVDPTKAVVKFNITKTDGTVEEKYFLSWEEATCELRDSGNAAEYKNWKRVEILLLKDTSINENAAQMVPSDKLPAELVLRSAGDTIYTLSGSDQSSYQNIALYTNGQKLTVENIKTNGASIKAVEGTVTIGNGASLAANGSWAEGTIDVTGSTLILEDGASVSSTYTGESTRTAIRMTDAASLRIQKGAQVTGRVYIDSGAAENSVVIEEGAALPTISDVSSAKASVYCNLDSTTADDWKAITSAKVYFLIECNGVALESYDNNITKYDGKIYGRFYESGVDYGYSTKIEVPDTVCSYQLTDGTITAVDADHTFQMPSAKVKLLRHSPDASGTCPYCSKTDLAVAYKNGKLQIKGLTGRTYDSQPQILTGITLTDADGRTKTLTGPQYYSGYTLAQDSTNPVNAAIGSVNDYDLIYENNINAYNKKPGDSDFDAAKAPKVTIIGHGNYTGTIEYYFTIGQGTLQMFNFGARETEYNGYSQGALHYGIVGYALDETDREPRAKIYMDGPDREHECAKVSTDKTIDNAGYDSVAAMKIEYSTDNGSTWTEIAENNQDTSKANYLVRDAGTYDFQVRVTDGDNATPAVQSLTATIKPQAITDPNQIVLDSSPITAYYTGNPVIPAGNLIKITAPYIPDRNGKTPYVLEKDTDFTVSAENNTEVTDQATLTISGIGNYTGTLTKDFSIAYAFELAQTTASQNHWYNKNVPAVFGVDDTTGDTADAVNRIVYRSAATADDTELSGDVKLYTTQADAIDGTKDSYTFTGEGIQTETLYGRDAAKGYITKPVTVTVQIDKTAPTWADADGSIDGYGIRIKENWWRTLVSKISFGHFYKDATLDLTLQANDRKNGVTDVSGIDKYYYYVDTITDAADGMAAKTAAELNALAEAGKFTEVAAGTGMTATGADGARVTGLLPDEGSYVVYAYAVDRAGNKSDYICTDGLGKDNTKPEITGMSVPSKDDGTLTDTTAAITFTGSEAGTYYYILKTAGETAPSTLEDLAVKSEDQTSGRTIWTAKKDQGVQTGILAADSSNQITLKDLTAATSYVLYVAATDHAGNAGTVVSQSFTTLKTFPYIQTAPVISGTYGETLKDMKIDAANARVTAAKDSNTVVSGTWSVKTEDEEETPTVGTDQKYTLVFTPTGADAGTYEPVTCKVVPVVSKAVPVVDTVLADTITYGDSLAQSQITGTMHRSASDPTEVPGTFAWKNANVRPAVADSGVTEYEAVFTPTDSKNYASVENVKVILTVNKAQHAPNMPGTQINAANSATKVSDVRLSSGWTWRSADWDVQLEVGTPVTATAEYTGNDKGNYVNETVQITITRSECDHTAGEILYTGTGEYAPTCKDSNGQMADGLGHRACTKCGAVIESGIIVKAAHSYSMDWTIDVAATTTSEGSKSRHCTVCGDRTDITVIPKLTNTGGGSGSGSGSGGGAGGGAVTPGQVDDTDHTNVPEQTDAALAKLRLKAGRSTAASQKLSWKKVKGADGYEIYVAPCNTSKKKYKLKLKRTVKRGKTSYTVKGLKSATAYRYVVKAYRLVDGRKVYIAKSAIVRATTKGKK